MGLAEKVVCPCTVVAVALTTPLRLVAKVAGKMVVAAVAELLSPRQLGY